MEKITDNFSMEEFVRSETADRLGLQNEPDGRARLSIVNLCSKVLQPLRNALGEPIRIDSGYRSPALNAAVGGVATSQHMKGEAADLSWRGKAGDLLELLEENRIPFDQAILYRKRNFLHVSLKMEGKQREQIIIKR